jgi:hypothetical protein
MEVIISVLLGVGIKCANVYKTELVKEEKVIINISS